MIRLHDRYLLRVWWTTFLVVVFFFSLVVLVLDLSDRFVKVSRQWDDVKAMGHDPAGLLVELYATFLPFVWMEILPFCLPIAAALSLARVMRHNELTPLLMSGVSMRRVVAPIVLSACAVAGVMLVAPSAAIGDLARRHMQLARILGKRHPDRIHEVPHFHDPSGLRVSMEAFLPINQRMESVWVTRWSEDGPVEILWYPELAWDETRRAWTAPRGGERIPMTGEGLSARRQAIPASQAVPVKASLSLLEVLLTLRNRLGLSYAQSTELLRADPQNPHFVMMRHDLLTGPLSGVVLLLLALPFATRVARRTASALPGMLAALALGILYFATTYFIHGLVGGGDLNPVLLAWLPTVTFGALGLALFVTLEG